MIAALEVVVEGTRVVRLAAAPPLAAKVLAGAAGPELVLVGAAASLLEGDRLTVALRLGPGASLTVRTAAATMAHPCPGPAGTVFDVDARLGRGARLAWLPEPLVACAGCRHRGWARVHLDHGAAAVWSETVALGRTGEQPGDLELRFDADVEGVPLLRDGLRLGRAIPGWAGPAVLDGLGHSGTVALLGMAAPPGFDVDAPGGHAVGPPRAPGGVRAGVLRLAGPGTVVRAVGPDGAGVERVLAPARLAFLAALAGAAGPPVAFPQPGALSPTPERRQTMVM